MFGFKASMAGSSRAIAEVDNAEMNGFAPQDAVS